MLRTHVVATIFASLYLGCIAPVDDTALEEDLELAPGEAEPDLAAEEPYDDELELGLSQAALIGPNDVGVIQTAGVNCPNEHIMLTLDNEKDGNWNETEGWIGATEQDHVRTKWHFCRVDGRTFHPVRTTSTAHNYAVLKLGNTCPAGSVEFERYFDNEDRPVGCPSWPWACAIGTPPTIGDYAPSYYSVNNLHMKFCMFRASSTTGSTRPLPSLGIPYGVFATPELPGKLNSGHVHTDDEDDGNANNLTGDFVGSSGFLQADAATTLHVVQVNPRLIFQPIGGNLGELEVSP